MDLQTAVKAFRDLQLKLHAYNHAMGVMHLDATTVAPAGTGEGRGISLGILSEAAYAIETSDEAKELVKYLLAHKDELSAQQAREVEMFARSSEYTASIPADEFTAYQVHLNKAGEVWKNAKNTNDFASFAPYLEKIVETNIKFAKYYKPEGDVMDTLLDQYERGFDQKQADAFFAALREKIVPLIAKIKEKTQIDDSFLHCDFPIDKQKEFSDYLMEVLCIDRNHCTIGETEHPYTTNFNKNDVRITTHYYKNDLTNSMYSVIHESGHATYELNCGDEYQYTCLSGGVSMGIHESQSRFFENIIGRSEAFCELIFPKVCELFPEQMQGKTAHDFYLAVNKSEPSLIRIQADELTYALHIMVRYEIEKALIKGEIKVSDLPRVWAEKMKEYLGVDVPDDARGCLQDSHWGSGSIGYFPTYALGSAYGAQFLACMEKDLDVYGLVREGKLQPIVDWLTEKIYRHASMYDPKPLFESVVGAEFDPHYFTDYLEKKYSAIYGL